MKQEKSGKNMFICQEREKQQPFQKSYKLNNDKFKSK